MTPKLALDGYVSSPKLVNENAFGVERPDENAVRSLGIEPVHHSCRTPSIRLQYVTKVFKETPSKASFIPEFIL